MNRNNRLNTIAYVAALFGAAMFVSCKNDINKVNALTGEAPPPETEINGFSMVRADSGFVAMRMTAGKVILEPDPKDRSMTNRKASQGVEIIMFKLGTDSISAKLNSDRAIEHASNGLSEALGNVIVVNGQNDSIMTERLIWDRKKHIFYTDEFARIVREGDVLLPKKGFEADENFRWYNLFNSKGEISIEDSLSRVEPRDEDTLSRPAGMEREDNIRSTRIEDISAQQRQPQQLPKPRRPLSPHEVMYADTLKKGEERGSWQQEISRPDTNFIQPK